MTTRQKTLGVAVLTAFAAGLVIAPTANAASAEVVTWACADLKAGDPSALEEAVDAWGRSGMWSENITRVKAGNVTAEEVTDTLFDAKGNDYRYFSSFDDADPSMNMGAWESATMKGVDYTNYNGKKWKVKGKSEYSPLSVNATGLRTLLSSDSGVRISDYTVIDVNDLGVTKLRHDGNNSVIRVSNDCRAIEYTEEIRHGGTDEAPDATYIRRTMSNVKVTPITLKNLNRGKALVKMPIIPEVVPAIDTSRAIPKDAA